MLNPDAKEYTKCSFLPESRLVLPDISVFYDKKDLLIPFTFKSVAKQRKELFKKPSGSKKWFKKIKK